MSTKNKTITESCLVNGENKKKINWRDVKNVDFSSIYKTSVIKKGVSKNGDPMFTIFIEGPEFDKGVYCNVLDKGKDAELRYQLMPKSVLNYESKFTPVIDFSLEFRKYICGFLFGLFPNASLELFQKNVIYRDGLAMDINELIGDVRLYNPSNTGNKNWKRVGVAYINLKCGVLKNVALLDCTNSHLPRMIVCNHPKNASLPTEERIDDIVLTKAVKNRLLSKLVADKRIILAPSKTGKRFVDEVQSEITGIRGAKKPDIFKEEEDGAKDYLNEVAFTSDFSNQQEDGVSVSQIFSGMTVKELKAYCKDNDIKIKSGMKKDQIVEAILESVNNEDNKVENCELQDEYSNEDTEAGLRGLMQ